MCVGSLPSVAPWNMPAAPAGAPGATTVPIRSTSSSAVPVCWPQVAVTAVLPPCGSTVAIAPVNDPNCTPIVSVHDEVMSVIVVPSTPNTW